MRSGYHAALILWMNATPFAFGQASLGTGSIHGIVLDSSGSAVTGARVTLVETGRQLRREMLSNASGSFLFANVPAAGYNLRVEKAGFESSEIERLEIQIGETATIEARLHPGETQSVITVSAQEQIPTETNDLGSVIAPEQVENLPLN